MDHVAIDLGSRKSQICVRGADGKISYQDRVDTDQLQFHLKRRAPSRVILETSSEAFAIADIARSLGHQVNVVPSTLSKALGVGSRGVKSDERDAQNLSEASYRLKTLPSVHVPSLVSRDRKMQCGMRETLVAQRTALVNTVRGWMRTELMRIRSGVPVSFPTRVREAALKRPQGLPISVERVLQVIELLNQQIKDADKELKTLAKADPLCSRLMTVPGVGPTVALRFVAAVDDVTRFPNAHILQSYLGLVPGERSSGMRQRKTGITKAGSTDVRWALTLAAHAARFHHRHDPMVLWSNKIAERSNRLIATMALARKIAGVLWAIWRQEDARYQPDRSAVVEPPMPRG